MRLFSFFSKKQEEVKEIVKMVNKKNLFLRYGMLALGIFIYACSYNLFMLHNDLVAGGVGGIATIAQSWIDPALLVFILSAFLLLLSLIFLGKEKTLASVIGSLLYPLFIKLSSIIVSNIHIDNSDLLLIVLFAGLCDGFGAGLVFKAGFTTGGTDILNQIVSKYAKVSLGTAMLMTDGLIVLSAGFFFGWTRVMYGIIILYIISLIADKVVLGISSNKAFYIVAEKEEEVKDYILNLGHGVTMLEAKGGYTNEKQKVFMCLIQPVNILK
jgi:uncharacterized membrane-anchored protein YitT (DUF2179 family)